MISSPLQKNAESVSVRRRRQSALASWDTGFTQDVTAVTSIEGYPSSQCVTKGVWEVVYCLTAQYNDNGTGESGPLLTFLLIGIFFSVCMTCHFRTMCTSGQKADHSL